MNAISWSEACKSPTNMKTFNTQMAAYFCSLHRREDGRSRSPEDDWLNGEWQLWNPRYYKLENNVVELINQTEKASGSNIYYYAGSDMPNNETIRTTLAASLPNTLIAEGFIVSANLCKEAVRQAQTIRGLLEFLTHEIRRAESR